ncbi:MAG: TraB/GumN family protein [Chitinophagaceae bacterium BSSC1]|nr:MAG: TraB/GumN family protein [Chitinophagaceae bacterium BSSC1]
MMLQKKLLILSLLLANISFSQNVEQSLLWKISGKGLKEPSYVFGTFHMMCKDQFQITQPMEDALTSSKKYYGELDMDDPNMPENMMKFAKLKDGKTIDNYMDPKEFAALDKKYQTVTGMSLMLLKQYKPFLGMSFLILKTVPCTATVQPETELMHLAQKKQIEVLGLETIEQQMNLLNNEPIDSQLAAMRKMVNNFDSSKQVMQALTKLYLKKDVDALYQFMKETGVNDNFESTMLIKRNKNWIPKMKKAMKESPSFFAVGAGHLGGKTGVLALLRKKGYKLEPIQY